MNILSLGSLRINRICICPIETDKVLHKQRRESYDYKADTRKGLSVVKWVDNKAVLLCTILHGIGPTHRDTVKRFCKAAKAKIDVN